MDNRYINEVWEMANQLVGKTFSLPDDYDARNFIKESKEKAKEHEWLYHCTDMAGVLGILKSKELWLTNLKDVNDSEEAERIDVPSYEKSYYVSCFTYEKAISEAHWIEYSALDNGVIIGIKKEWVSKLPVFMTSSRQKCTDEFMKIYGSAKTAFDYKIEQELSGKRGIDPFHIFDFDFYQIVYDDNLRKNILGKCTMDFDGVLVPGKSLSQGIPGIIKSREGWCKRQGKEKYWKNWEDEKEVRLKVGVHRLSANDGTINTSRPSFKYLAVPLVEDSFNEIRIGFSPKNKEKDILIKEIKELYPKSKIELL